MDKIVAMLHKIVAAATSWMQDRPFDTYMFLYHFPRGPGWRRHGARLLHRNLLNAETLARAPDALASVTAHEFFHLWNVKRIRPQTLEPVDYTKENYTRALWFSEGCTSTAADFIQLRGGLIDERRFEQQLASGIGELERRPAHLTQSAEESSLDAWLEGNAYYRRPSAAFPITTKASCWASSLIWPCARPAMGRRPCGRFFEWMNQNYAKKGRFFADSEGVREAAEAVSHADLGMVFHQVCFGNGGDSVERFLSHRGIASDRVDKYGCGYRLFAPRETLMAP